MNKIIETSIVLFHKFTSLQLLYDTSSSKKSTFLSTKRCKPFMKRKSKTHTQRQLLDKDDKM